MDVRVTRTEDLSVGELRAIRALMDEAFGGEFDDDDWDHTVGGQHVVVTVAGTLVAHAAVVARTLHVGHRPFRTGYVEGVATAPAHQRRGYGTAAMTRIGELVRCGFEFGALGTGEWLFYERLGWERWHGPTGVRTAAGTHRTEEDDDGVMVLRFGPSAAVDLRETLTCEVRPGDVW